MIELKKFSIDKDFYMKEISQIPTDPDFVQNPYHFYKNVRGIGPFVYWKDYSMVTTFDHSMTAVILKDRRFGREVPKELVKSIPQHLLPFYKNEAHSMLELEPPAHTRLRGLVMRAFTSRRIKELEPEINVLCNQLIDKFPSNDFDLIPSYANQIRVIVIARLLGVPENMSNQLLKWSNDMVSMYQARRNREIEDRAVKSCEEFVSFMNYYVKEKRNKPADDLITHLIQAEEEGETKEKAEPYSGPGCYLIAMPLRPQLGHKLPVRQRVDLPDESRPDRRLYHRVDHGKIRPCRVSEHVRHPQRQ